MNSLINRLAIKSGHRQRHVVVVERGGAIAATGYNHDGLHAEVVALSKIWPNQRKGLKVWSFRLKRDGTLGMAKPCAKCQQFLRDNGIKIVLFSNVMGQMERMKL